MRPILIDTNAYAAFLRGNSEIIEVLTHADRLFINPVVLGELLGGFAAGNREARNRSELSAFLNSPRVDVLALTADTADSYALVYSALRAKGQPIPSNDMWIAASALEHGLALLTLDAHFDKVDGLRAGANIACFLP